jgi:hypothetical protein
MHTGKLVFAQLMEHLPLHTLCTRRHCQETHEKRRISLHIVTDS